jgi:hypothetical protein
MALTSAMALTMLVGELFGARRYGSGALAADCQCCPQQQRNGGLYCATACATHSRMQATASRIQPDQPPI